MRSLEAIYQKRRFRSRLEARWAMFYDSVGVEWAYEPEAIDLGKFSYQPDFWLKPFQAWNEIKGEIVDDKAGLLMIEKCAQLAAQSGRPVILNFHDPLDPVCAVFSGPRYYPESRWTHCPTCGKLALGVKGEGLSYTWCPRKHEEGPLRASALRAARRLLYDAAVAARQHRFGVTKKQEYV